MTSNAPPVNETQRNGISRFFLTHLRGPHSIFWAGVISFLETIILFLPIDLMLLPYMMLNRQRVWLIATVVTFSSVAAAIFGYGLSFLFFDQFGEQVIAALGLTEHYPLFLEYANKYGFWSVFIIAITPIPFKIAILGAGAIQYSFWAFCLATILGRGGRYFTLATITALFGNQAEVLYKKAAARISPRWIQGGIVIALLAIWLILH